MIPQGCHQPDPQYRIFLNSNVGDSPGPTIPFLQHTRGWGREGLFQKKRDLKGYKNPVQCVVLSRFSFKQPNVKGCF